MQLVGNSSSEELGIGLGVLHLNDVEFDGAAGDLVEPGPQAIGLDAAPADHDTGAGGMYIDLNLLTDPFDLDPGEGAAQQLAVQVVADLGIFVHEIGIPLVGVPA